MTRIYANSGFSIRMNASAAITVLAVLYGFFEIWMAARAGTGGSGYGYIFALFFIGGGVYGMRQILNDFSDTVASIDADEAGNATIVVWRPFRSKVIADHLDRLTEWRPYAKQTRNTRTPMLLADHPDHPRPLQFEIGKSVKMEPAFRAMAGEALVSLEKPPQ